MMRPRRSSQRWTAAAVATLALLVFGAALCALPVAASPRSSWHTLTWLPSDTLLQNPFTNAASSLVNRLMTMIGAIPAHDTGNVQQFALSSVYHQGIYKHRGLSARYDYDAKDRMLLKATEQDLGPLRTARVKSWKPKNIGPYLQAHRDGDAVGIMSKSRAVGWDEIEIEAPDVSDRNTLLTLAKMASRAYEVPPDDPGSDKWHIEKSQKWNLSDSFGWVSDGIRGHIFTSRDESTIVVALKGTSAALLDDGSTSKRDKENDNLLFSCCCARVGWTWHNVCDCFDDKAKGGPTCSSSCLTKALIQKSFFYPATTDLFNNISYAYPEAQIWITGHSLGGALGSLIGMTFGYPTVTFESPAERMAATRLHLPLPTEHANMDELPITHVYHTGDPIPMGECVGATSLCANFGFAMESKCHAGKTILYDTIGKLGWSSSVVTHRISTLVDDLLAEDWDKKVSKAKLKQQNNGQEIRGQGKSPPIDEEKLGSVPHIRSEKDCVDCSDWNFVR